MPRLGDILVKSRQLTDSQLQTAVQEQKRWGGLLGEILLRMDYISEPVLVDALTKQMGIPLAEPALLRRPEPSAQRRLPFDLAKQARAIPLQVKEKGKVLVVAMVEPQNLILLDELRKATGCRITPFLIGPLTFLSRLNELYGSEEFSEEPAEGSFKMVDAQGRTLIKAIADIEREGKERQVAAVAAAAAVPSSAPQFGVRPPSAVNEILGRLEEAQRQEVAILRAMVELLIERGVFTRDEYLARVRR